MTRTSIYVCILLMVIIPERRQVFKEEHEKQTEVLLKQLRTEEKPASPCEDVPQLKDEIKVRYSWTNYNSDHYLLRVGI